MTDALREAFELYFADSRRGRGAGRAPTFARMADGTYADDPTQRHWWTWQNACRPALAAPAVLPGWQLVPAEPTPAMQRAAVESREGRAVYKVASKAGLEALEDIAADDYRAMLAAAPTAQQEPTP